MRREELYLTDIVEAADAIEQFLADREQAAFERNDLLRSAVLQKLTIIGEAVARLPIEFREQHPRSNGVISSAFATSPFTVTSLCSGQSFGLRQLRIRSNSDVKSLRF